jgi:hypothetical protein
VLAPFILVDIISPHDSPPPDGFLNISSFQVKWKEFAVLTVLRSAKRAPSWTDRILYASRFDPVEDDLREEERDAPPVPSERTHRSVIENLVYTSVPSYTTSDHVSYTSFAS